MNQSSRNMKQWTWFSKFLLLCVTVITMVVLGGCGTSDQGQGSDGKLKVVVSFNGMREFTAAVGGDKVDIITVIPDGTEPHDFELKPEDMKRIAKANVFVYNGLGMEPWAEQAIESVHNDKFIVVRASDGVSVITTEEEDSEPSYQEPTATPMHGSGGGHGQGGNDPHTWLSLKNAVIEVTNIKNALVKADPDNAAYYEKNYTEYIGKLNALQDEYEQKFSTVPNKDFITGHAAFAYMCRDFGLRQQSVEDVFAEGEPNAAQLAKLVEYVKHNYIRVIFAEQMASPEASQTLANEVGAKVESIYTMESSEDGKSYLERMSDNLAKIYGSMK